jgi:2-amino-4-hydroxy-6-hydroxymethyldihydropteridine diphosphokinase
LSAAGSPERNDCAGRTQAARQVCVVLGSNIHPEENLPAALVCLRQELQVERVSQVWQSPAVGSDGPDFLNAAALVTTALSPPELKERLRAIEARLGRRRSADKNAPRTIDLDIAVVDGQVIDPEVWERVYLAVPLAELLPRLPHPHSGEPLEQVAARLAQQQSIRLRAEVLAGMEGAEADER